jgi:hypothetical protein
VNALASALKMRALISAPAETDTSTVFELSNVAVSEGPFGTVDGVQLVAEFQSPVAGLTVHLALPALRVVSAVNRKDPPQSRVRTNIRKDLIGVFIDLVPSWGLSDCDDAIAAAFFYLALAEKGKLNRRQCERSKSSRKAIHF